MNKEAILRSKGAAAIGILDAENDRLRALNAELVEAAEVLDRLSLLIESSVRRDNSQLFYQDIVSALRNNRAAIAKAKGEA
jgi:hypothetical protein